MKINSINTSKLSFKRALKPEEVYDYADTLEKGRKALGADGKNILNIPDVSLPSKYPTGVGNFGDPLAVEFLETMKTYLGINTVLTTPQGAYFVDSVGNSFRDDNIDNCKQFNPFTTSSFLLSDHVINPEILTYEEYGGLINFGDFKQAFIVPDKNENAKTHVQLGNFLAPYDTAGVEKLLIQAYKKLDDTNILKPQLDKFREEEGEFITKRVIFEKLAQEHNTYKWETWPEGDKHLYSDDSGKTEFSPQNQGRIAELTKKYQDDIDFAVFKQFFAHKSLEEAKAKLNNRGIKLISDMQLAFSEDEIWANQHYFDLDSYIGMPGWQIHPIKIEKMFEDASGKTPYSLKMIETKVAKKLQHYDGIRIDAAWAYIQPHLTDKAGMVKTLNSANSEFIAKDNYIGSTILDVIEKTAKKVKGENFDTSNLFYETEVGPGVKFSAFDYNGRAISPLKNKVQIYTTRYKNADGTWGSYPAYTKERRLKPEEFILTTTTHDNAPLENVANAAVAINGNKISAQSIDDQRAQLQSYLKTEEPIYQPEKFKDAKQAEVSLAKNQMRFFYDIFGWNVPGNADEGSILKTYYGTKVGDNYKTAYLKSLEDGKGFNPMNALRQAFVAKGLDRLEPELFRDIVYYDKILRQKESSK